MTKPFTPDDADELVRSVMASDDPIHTAMLIIGLMSGVLEQRHGREAAVRIFRAVADKFETL